jgi:hypothetical protein
LQSRRSTAWVTPPGCFTQVILETASWELFAGLASTVIFLISASQAWATSAWLGTRIYLRESSWNFPHNYNDGPADEANG